MKDVGTLRCQETPWGRPDSTKELAPGIVFYGTSSHGGYGLDAERNAKIPDYMRSQNGFYEEDQEWAIVVTVFPDADPKHVEAAERTLRDCMPDRWEKWYQRKLQPGESHGRDREHWHDAHKHRYQAIACWGDWKANVPKGHVLALAQLGGRSADPTNPQKWFLLTKEEYDAAHIRFGILIPEGMPETEIRG